MRDDTTIIAAVLVRQLPSNQLLRIFEAISGGDRERPLLLLIFHFICPVQTHWRALQLPLRLQLPMSHVPWQC